LHANDATELLVGSGVFFRGVKAGEIVDMFPSQTNNSISVWVYIEPQYAHLIGDDSDFWLNSFAKIDFKGGTFNLSLAPLTSILIGGISFSASSKPLTQEELESRAFKLKSSKSDNQSVTARAFNDKNVIKVITHTNQAIGSLEKSSIVKFQGFKIGEVRKINPNFDSKSGVINTKISMLIDTNFFEDKNSNISPKQNFIDAIQKGLSVRIVSTDPITQRQVVEFFYPQDIQKTKKQVAIAQDEKTYRIPDVVSQSGTLADNANEVLKTLQSSLLRINKSADNADEALKILQSSLLRVNKSMENLDATMSSFKQLADSYKEGSLHSTQITDMLREITKASKETQKLIQKIEQKPNALIFGDGE